MRDARRLTRGAVEAEFDAKAPTYEEGRLGGWYKAHGSIILDQLASIRGPVLDVGCGTAWLLRNLVRRDASLVGVGVDISGEMIRVGGERGATESARLRLLHGDWEDATVRARALEALGAPAGAVVCANAFHYFQDPAAVLATFLDALAPGGKLFLFERAREGSPATGLWHLLHRFVVRDSVRFYHTDTLRAMLERAGFVDVQVVARIRRLFWKGKVVSSLAFLSARRPGVA